MSASDTQEDTPVIFEGDIKQWSKSCDQYTRVVDRRGFSNAEKFQYLKLSLRGEPLTMINNETTFPTAWKLLASRYTNHRQLMAQILDKLLDQPVCTGDSGSLHQLHDTVKQCVQELSVFMDASIWDQFLNRIVMHKLDPESKKIFEDDLDNGNEIPSVCDILIFIKKRIYQPLLPIAEKKGLCNYCSGNHMITECCTFLKLTATERKDVANAKGLCNSCLGNPAIQRNGFLYNSCSCVAPICYMCFGSHHTVLHEKLPIIAIVRIQSKHQAYVMIDPKAKTSTISENVLSSYGLSKYPLPTAAPDLFEVAVTVNISPHFKSDWSLTTKLQVVCCNTSYISTNNTVKRDIFQDGKSRVLANPQFNYNSYTVILGADNIHNLAIKDVEEGDVREGYVIQNSELGWLIHGGHEYPYK